MADFILQDNEHVTLAIQPVDAAGNPTAGFDDGSVTATFPETSNLTAVVSQPDQLSVLVTAEGPLVTDDVLTITGTVGGVSVSTTFPFDVTAGPPSAIDVTPGTPEAN